MLINVNVEVPDLETSCGRCRFLLHPEDIHNWCTLFMVELRADNVGTPIHKCEQCLNATRVEHE